ncbi:PfkB family carbohydrate kinase [Paludibacterium yongneupense]|uniref:PfkB family carbohydrate kinase n=1 Tax=Paludibacterium yongneupense TaxID=400061 RepID=UPI0004169AB1|nr:PfkB family carbohydrate kinase [Paludibacterium yongneupense]
MPRLVCVGDNTSDVYLDRDLIFPGGNAVNVAVQAARQGASVAYLGRVGADARGAHILDSLRKEGVDIARCQIGEGPTAWACVTHRNGERHFLGSHSAESGKLAPSADDLLWLSGFDLIHTSLYSRLGDVLAAIPPSSARLSFDFSDDFTLDDIAGVASCIDIAFLSQAGRDDEDCARLARDIHALGIGKVIITRGEHGALAYDGALLVRQPIVETRIVDTLGAGDAFIAGCLLALSGTDDLPAALQAGSRLGAAACIEEGGYGHAGRLEPDFRQLIEQALCLTQPNHPMP